MKLSLDKLEWIRENMRQIAQAYGLKDSEVSYNPTTEKIEAKVKVDTSSWTGIVGSAGK